MVVYGGRINNTEVEIALDPSTNRLLVTRYGTSDMSQILLGGFAATHGGEPRQSNGDLGVTVDVPFNLREGHYTFAVDVGSNSSFNGGPEQSSVDVYFSSDEFPGTNQIANLRVDAPAPGVAALIDSRAYSNMSDWSGRSGSIDRWDVTVRPFTVVTNDLRGPSGVQVVYDGNPANATVTAENGVHMQVGESLQCNPGSVDNLRSTPIVVAPGARGLTLD